MLFDARLNPNPASVAQRAQQLEAAGYGRGWTHEERHDPFVSLALAATKTERIELGTNIAVAFARNPMTTAQTAWDLQLLSEGRFVLGLGAQVRGHITRRFSMPWSKPAARMREYVTAMHHIWDTWEHGRRLNFRGDFYEHTLTRAMFIPPTHAYGRPKVHLAAVGPLMTQVAGRVADGMLCHSFTTESYMRQVTLPNLEAALEDAERTRDDFEVSYLAMAVVADTAESLEAQSRDIRERIAMFGCTPAYRRVWELHGWGEAQPELLSLYQQGRLADMADLIDDEMLRTFAAVGTPTEVADILLRRYGDLVDRVTLMPARALEGARSEMSVLFPAAWDPLIDRLRSHVPPTRSKHSLPSPPS